MYTLRGPDDAAMFDAMSSSSVDPTSGASLAPTFTLDPEAAAAGSGYYGPQFYQPGLGTGAFGSFGPFATDTNSPSGPNSPNQINWSQWIIPGAFVLLIVLLAAKR